jgi:nucleoside-diphosphate-sugar epimerase
MRAVVTGATGFIGGALTRALLTQGWEVVALTRRRTGLPEKVVHVAWELGAVVPAHALEDVDVVFHVAARVGDWGRQEDFERDNVDATRSLLEACERARVRAFVFTSSPSAFLGDHDVVEANETLEPPAQALSAYGASKAKVDALVRAHRGVTRTVVLRPHAVHGPGDRHLRKLVRGMAWLGVVPEIGAGDARISITSIETCVEAHLRAAERLLAGLPSGRAYFVADSPSVPLTALLVAEVQRLTGRTPRILRLGRPMASSLARFAEWFHRPFPNWAPVVNRYRVAMLSRSHTFDVSRMVDELGVTPRDARRVLEPGHGLDGARAVENTARHGSTACAGPADGAARHRGRSRSDPEPAAT